MVSTSPAQGQRLSQAPDSLLLEFSEKIDLASTELRLLSPEGTLVAELRPELSADGLGIRATVETPEEGIYVVSWQAQSVVDGHGSSGEYAFSTEPVSATGALPDATQSEPVDKASLISSWLFGFGLAGALGGLVLRAIDMDPILNTRAVVRTGLFFGLAGVATAAWSDGSKPAMLAVAAQLLFVPLVLVGAGRHWKLATGSTMVAAGAWASRSHGAAEGPVGWAVDYLHLVVGAAWAGSLGLVLVLGWQARRSRTDWLPAVRRYARPAMWFVLVLGTTGSVAALSLIPDKIMVFGAALVAALAARRWGLRRSHAALARRAMTAEGVFVVSAIALAGVLASGAPPQDAATAEQLLGPVPLSSQVSRDAGLAGQLNVEVSSDRERLDIRIFGPSGTLPGTEVQAVLTDPTGPVAGSKAATMWIRLLHAGGQPQAGIESGHGGGRRSGMGRRGLHRNPALASRGAQSKPSARPGDENAIDSGAHCDRNRGQRTRLDCRAKENHRNRGSLYRRRAVRRR